MGTTMSNPKVPPTSDKAGTFKLLVSVFHNFLTNRSFTLASNEFDVPYLFQRVHIALFHNPHSVHGKIAITRFLCFTWRQTLRVSSINLYFISTPITFTNPDSLKRDGSWGQGPSARHNVRWSSPLHHVL